MNKRFASVVLLWICVCVQHRQSLLLVYAGPNEYILCLSCPCYAVHELIWHPSRCSQPKLTTNDEPLYESCLTDMCSATLCWLSYPKDTSAEGFADVPCLQEA